MTTSKSYDYLNRLQQIASAPGASGVAPVSFNYSYNDANQRTRRNETDASYWVYQYDTLGQVISGKKYWSDGTPVPGQQFEYGFDDIGNRTSTKAGGDSSGSALRAANYSANTLNQYTSRDVPNAFDVLGASHATNSVTVNGSPADFRRGEYFQELLSVVNSSTSVWQRVAVTNTGGTWSTGNVFVAKTPEAYTYDADGNLTADGRWTYAWDAENRLINMTSGSSTPTGSKFKMDFAYDWKGRRIEKQVSTNNGTSYFAQYTNRFVYDDWNLVAILNPQNALIQSYVWGLDLSGSMHGAGGVGGLLAVNDATNGVHFCAFDGNGNLAALINAVDGTVSANYEYGPFGEVLRASGTMAKTNLFRFSTKYQDNESDQLYYGYRSYNPSTGRWLSRDPIEEGGGINIYGFVQNNQVNGADKLGLDILVYCPEGYFSELGLEKGVHYTGNGNTYSAIPGRYNPGNDTEKLIVWRMLSTSHKYKALGLRVGELKKHVQARLTIVRNALRANFRFDVDGGLTGDEFLEFKKNPAKFFESINDTGRGFACQEMTMILFETGNQFWIRDSRGYDGIWVPGDWAYISNRSYTPGEWGRGYSGENLIHTGTLFSKDAYGDLFWGHFVEYVHPSITEREWFNDIKEWQSIDGTKSGDPHWSGNIKGPGFGLEPNYRGE